MCMQHLPGYVALVKTVKNMQNPQKPGGMLKTVALKCMTNHWNCSLSPDCIMQLSGWLWDSLVRMSSSEPVNIG